MEERKFSLKKTLWVLGVTALILGVFGLIDPVIPVGIVISVMFASTLAVVFTAGLAAVALELMLYMVFTRVPRPG